MDNISAHLQVHKNQKAVDEFLRRFRLHFPKINLYIHGDNGYDYSALKDVYDFEYTHWDTSISPRGLSGGNWRGYLERVLMSCKKYDSEWMIFLEEDVNTLHNNIIFPTCDFAGIKGHCFTNEFTSYVRNLYPNMSDIRYNMCGGSIVKMKPLIESIESVLNGKFNLDEISKLDSRIINYSDVLVSAILLLNGCTYGEWEQLSETASGVFKENAIFDHSWKEFYNKTDWETFVNY